MAVVGEFVVCILCDTSENRIIDSVAIYVIEGE